jgi:hypothetical protein
MKFRVAVAGLLLAAVAHPAFSQQPASQRTESHKYRAICLLAGAGGGFTAGVFVGFAAFDDAVNSDRKVWTTALIGAAGGAVGGYFLGRALDRRRAPKGGGSPAVIPWVPDDLDLSLMRARAKRMWESNPGAPGPPEILARSYQIFQRGTVYGSN